MVRSCLFFQLLASFLKLMDCDDIWYLSITPYEFNWGLHQSGMVIKCDKTKYVRSKGKKKIKPVCVCVCVCVCARACVCVWLGL
jgi:hypothetical protein